MAKSKQKYTLSEAAEVLKTDPRTVLELLSLVRGAAISRPGKIKTRELEALAGLLRAPRH